jgi:hypothetical protein
LPPGTVKRKAAFARHGKVHRDEAIQGRTEQSIASLSLAGTASITIT